MVTDFSWLMRKCELGLLDSISHDYELLRGLSHVEMKKRLELVVRLLPYEGPHPPAWQRGMAGAQDSAPIGRRTRR